MLSLFSIFIFSLNFKTSLYFMISPFSLVCVENINPILSFYGVFVMKHFIYLNVAKEIHLKNSIALSL